MLFHCMVNAIWRLFYKKVTQIVTSSLNYFLFLTNLYILIYAQFSYTKIHLDAIY